MNLLQIVRQSHGRVCRYLAECVITALLMAMPVVASGQSAGLEGGLEKTEAFFSNIINILLTIAVSVATIALIFLGFKFLFGNGSFQDIIKPVVGCLIIACSSGLALYMLN